MIDEEGINKRLDELDALLNNTKYAKQKRTLKDDLIKFLNKMNPPKDLSNAYPSDVRLFLAYLLTLPRKSLISRMDWVSCAGDINLPHTPFPPPNKKKKYNKILIYILRSIFLEIPHLEMMKNAERYEW